MLCLSIIYRQFLTSLRIGEYEALKEAAIDSYVKIRNAWVQNRNKFIDE